MVLNLENQFIFGIIVLEFRKPIYGWNYGIGISKTKLCLELGILENQIIFGIMVL